MSCPTVNIEVCQGADFVEEFLIEDDEGSPLDITGYDDLRAELRSGVHGPTGDLQATATVTIVGSGTEGTVEVFIAHADTYAITEATGWWTLQIEKTSTAKTRQTVAAGTYTLAPTTISSP